MAVAMLATIQPLPGQTNENVVILNHADSLVGLEKNGERARELIGNVKFTHGKVVVSCDRAVQYLQSNKVDLEGHVVVHQDTLTILSNRGKYYAGPKTAEAFDDVRLDDGRTQLHSEYGQYFVDEKKAFFRTNVSVHDSSTTLTSDELTYFRGDQKSIANGNVVITNAENRITLFGNHFENYKKQNYSKMTAEPVAMEFDTSSDGTIDTLIVTSQLMESYQDSIPRLVATDSVTMTRSGIAAKGGFGIFFIKLDSIVLRQSPIVWYTHSVWETTQVSGDSMFIKLNKRKLERVDIHGRAIAISRADSTQQYRYHQMTGQRITMCFADNTIEHIEIDRTATVLYYLFDSKKPNGSNKTSGDHVSILFQNKKIDKIKVKGGVEGQYLPEKMVRGREHEYNLPGFNWQQQFHRKLLTRADGQPLSPIKTSQE